ncbi:nuclear transport factor 2 family protein [Streptomyces sp. NK08204]|uniref:nuclear transport factor 2 family protein n=1 Tax=Streptomyces sp. NK08204 TaxID=2873260 RepID=UPI001CED8FF6|nr:nuclear transport factor 2 family protein [Streptomyces sp. NK08204]
MTHDRSPSDITDVTQLVLHERRSRDRGWWDAQRECFAPDSTVRVSWFRGTGADFVTESEKLAANGEDATHSVGPPVVDLHRDRALAEVPCHMELRTHLDDTPVMLSCHARLLYRAERRSDEWLIASLDAVYERDAVTPHVPGTRLHLDEEKLATFRPSYRMLAYLLGQRGYSIAEDLYGDDRPEHVAALHRSAWTWLRNGR